MRWPILLSFCAGLTGCSSLVPSSVSNLHGVSPLEADPAGFVVRLNLPGGVNVVPDSAQLALSAERSDTGEALSGTFVLTQSRVESYTFFRVADQDVAPLRDLQKRINAWETEDPEASSGSLSVSLTGCSVMGGPDLEATVSVALQVDQAQPFFPLLRDAPLKDILTQADIEGLQPCS